MKKMNDLFSKGKARHGIAGAIEDITKQLQEVAERRARYKVDENLAKPAVRTSTIAAMYDEVMQFIGIDKARGELISTLSYQRGDDVSEKKMKKVSVVGVGGLGKTTLAKAVYDKLKGDFDCGAFVPVGRNPDLKKFLRGIIIDLDKEHYMKSLDMINLLDERQLIDEIRKLLKNRRYFIVIDDIWETQSWKTIKLALVENNCGSRIITTTRKFEVAREAGEVYKLQPLSCDDSKKLFYTRIFGGEGTCLDNQPDEIPDKILKKCDGIPLAIITMASLLVGKPREEWCELYSAIGFGHKDNMHVENTMRILSFSYYDLPSHLKTCLLYLSAFPEDYVIEKDPLIWKWIAEGFVHEKQGNLSLFELGEGYFNDLVNRSMIQAVENEWDGIVVGCRVGDMVLDLIRSLSYEENFVAILDDVEGTLSQSNVRRLSHQNRTMKNNTYQANHMDMPQVRSYIMCRCDISQLVLLSSFKFLRVLVIENCRFGEDCYLENLGNLLHLRYLGLRGTNIRELPKEIGDLMFLQTLDVEETGIKELPASVVRLTQLMCLCTNWWSTSVPDGIGKLTSLEELRIRTGSDEKSQRQFVRELGCIRGLRMLATHVDVMDGSMQRDLVKSLSSLHKIQHLTLEISTPEVDIAIWEAAGFTLPRHLRYLAVYRTKFSRMPSCINPAHLPNLTTLELGVVSLDERDLKLLARLTELRYLRLYLESTVTVSNINASDGCFQKLRVFSLPWSMAQFERSKEDSSISLHLWNGTDAMPFKCSTENDCSLCAIPSAVMPSLQVLRTAVFVRALKDGNGDCANIGLEYLTSLRKVEVCMNCKGASAAEVDEAEAALRNKTDVHPNRPTLKVDRYNEDETVKDLNDLQQGTPTTTGETSSEVVQRSQELYAPTVREDSRYMELNILERIVDGIEEPSHLEFPLLQRITENFSNNTQIGSGGCGVVYKGILRNGAVAVKKLYKRQTITDKMFHREVKSLITVNHQNIVRFLGYCSFTVEHAMPWNGEIIMVDIRERMLCLEYISNGSLESHCTDEMRGLEWHTRYQIIMGICKGLLYLHKEKGIVHMDLKPANILLDDDMVPKITDFGLSRLDNTSQATTTTRRVSPGYCAPEYISQGKMSSKSDIYSLGKIIMELVTGSKEEPDITKVLRRWRHRWIKSLKYTPLVYQQVKECLDLALRCMQHNPKARPDISDIIDELNKIESSDMTIQTIPCLDDMLGIEPLEVNFPFAHDQQMSCSIQLANNTDDYIAFMLTKANLRQGDSSAFMNTKANLRQFQTQPNKGIVPPQSKCSVTVTMPAQDKALLQNHYRGELTVQSTRIDGSLGAMDITGDVFIEEEGKVVDEVNVMVVFGTPPLPK